MVTVRQAVEADVPAILEIYNDIILHTTAVYDYEPHSFEMRKNWFDEKKKDGFPVFVASDENIILGFSSLGAFRKWEAYKYSAENSLYVAEASRGKGIGSLLLKELIESASTMNMHTIIAGIDAENMASINLHRSFGFLEVAHFRQVGYKFNRWLDLKFFQLILNTPKFL